jgi:CubicO group peptidase (beta-lactamase class C family)
MSRPGSPETAVEGTVAPGFEPLREAFAEVVASQTDESGAAFAATVDGRTVVDLWGGAADAGRPWQVDTLCVLFSGTKGVVATALLVLADRGALRLTDRVADHWPEFGANGKGEITVAQLGAHAAGLPWIEERMDADALSDPVLLADALAAQAPVLPVGRPCYHALTFGWLCDGLVRRVAGRSVTELIGSDLAAPLELDLRIGLEGDTAAAGRLARLRRAPDYELSALAVDEPDPRLELVYRNPPIGDFVASVGWLQPAIASANGIATARAMATLYGAVVSEKLASDAMLAAAIGVSAAGDDPLTGRPLRFGPTGYELSGTPSELGPPADAFGHTGAGGSSHGGWPELRTGFSFLTSELRREDLDQRSSTLLATLHGCVVG